VNTKATVRSSAAAAMRMLALGGWLAIALAACGKSQNYLDHDPAYVKIGGSVTGLNGTLVLQNNAGDDLAVSASGPFTFGLQIANGAKYKATIKTQPIGQVCSVSNGSGTARADVNSIAVNCLSDVTIGGTISGLAGTLVLQNNGANPLATASDGPFTFTAKIAPGGRYAVTVRTQPVGQNCSIANGSGSATANVTNVAVTCSVFTIRPLPAIYTTGKAINYSPYRAAGPGAEVPSDAQVLEDLALLHAAGFNLLRMFGADDVSDKVLRLAAANYPEMKFHQGIYLAGISTCADTVNDAQIAKGISLANTYTNVVGVSVGNETSFFSKYMPVACLANYITTVRNAVTQPVTADDDSSFFAGLTVNNGVDIITVVPDTILPLLDFVSIHIYPFSNTQPGKWNWQQSAVVSLDTTVQPNRPEEMMKASMAWARARYDLVAGYHYTDASGSMTTTGASLPIVIGETGWKAALNGHPQPGNPIEVFSQPPTTTPYPVSEPNAKWYYELSNQLPSWTATPAWAPKTVFYFEAFDETWKQQFNDDGWGLWDAARSPRYVLCGTAVAGAPSCDTPLYLRAGYWH
jgi:exo-beta-1,3-glucanase (GH17 family)